LRAYVKKVKIIDKVGFSEVERCMPWMNVVKKQTNVLHCYPK